MNPNDRRAAQQKATAAMSKAKPDKKPAKGACGKAK